MREMDGPKHQRVKDTELIRTLPMGYKLWLSTEKG
jgi:hypothetical protein